MRILGVEVSLLRRIAEGTRRERIRDVVIRMKWGDRGKHW